ncbi:caspase family protein [Marivibrio halodurans]|uniref:Caspase family protein n=1 Tax=Marivibrio halodurans TaxID=2039722 RepID=A0A8J7V2G7_9PROT|nr:caspase family protein [Marivibrio halodurans]MBP5857141.1 caspase family protein [Marivibrio halodurans]
MPSEPIVRVAVGAHTAAVNRLYASRDGARAISVSDDQTVRLWDAREGTLLHTVRGAAGPRDEGAIYAAARSDQHLAVGGRLGWDWGEGRAAVRMLSADGTRPLGVLRGLPAPVRALAFSPDGGRLAVGLTGPDQGVRVFDLASGRAVLVDRAFEAGISDLLFLKDGRLVVLDGAGALVVHDGAAGGRLGRARVPNAATVWRLALSGDGGLLAVTDRGRPAVAVAPVEGEGGFRLFEVPGLRLGGLADAAWSRDGAFLHAVEDARTTRNGGFGQRLHSWSRDGGYIGAYDLAETGLASPITALTGDASSNGTEARSRILFGAASGAWGALDIAPDGTPSTAFFVRGGAPSFRGAYRHRPGSDRTGNAVSFTLDAGGKERMVFRADEGTLAPWTAAEENGASPLIASPRTAGGRPLTIDAESGEVALDQRILPLDANERALDAIADSAGERLFLGTNYYLRARSVDGRDLWRRVAGAPVWGLALSGDGRVLIALLGDGTVQWRSAENGALLRSMFATRDGAHWVAWTPAGFFDHSPRDANGRSGADLIGYQMNEGFKEEARFVRIDQMYRRFYRPDLVRAALGARAGDAALLAAAAEAEGSAADTLKGDLPAAVAITEVCGVTDAGDSVGCAAPKDQPGTRAMRAVLGQAGGTRDRAEILLEIDLAAGTAGAVEVRRNGVRLTSETTGTIEGEHMRLQRERIALVPGRNEIEVRVLNDDGTVASGASTVLLDGPAPGSDGQGVLRVLAAGVSDYAIDHFDLTAGIAANDARVIARRFARAAGQGGLFTEADVTVMVESEVTAERLLAALADLAGRARSEDTVILFLSGHGDVVDGDYAFAPHEFGTASMELIGEVMSGRRFQDAALREIYRREAVSQSAMMDSLTRIGSDKLIIILDTCFAGSFQVLTAGQMADRSQSLVDRVARDSGRFVLSSARGTALDSDGRDYPAGMGHGLFTSAAIDGLDGAADMDSDRAVSLAELGGYVKREVIARSEALGAPQHPVAKFWGDPFFPLSRMAPSAVPATSQAVSTGE